MRTKLRLGPIPKTETVKLTIALSTTLKTSLDRYAELHAQVWGQPISVAALIPFMLETFIARDRGFRKAGAVAVPPIDVQQAPDESHRQSS
jgi:hypothetical protein